MPAPKIRADYDGLKRVAQAFGRQAEAAKHLLDSLKKQKAVLEGGDWVGQGATAFYHEMNGAVLPTLARLAQALESAAHVTGQISAAMKQAEEDAARVLRGDGARAAGQGEGAGLALGAAPGPAGSPAGAPANAAGSFQSFSAFGAAQAGGAETNLFDADQLARWRAQADQNQKAFEELKQQEKAQLEKANAEVLRRIDEHLKAGMSDPFPNLKAAEKKRAQAAKDAYDRFLMSRPGYDATYNTIQILVNDSELHINDEHELTLQVADQKQLRDELLKIAVDVPTEAVVDEVQTTILEKVLGEELNTALEVGGVFFQAVEVLKQERDEKMLGAIGREADEWRAQKKRSLVFDDIAQATGRNKADLLDQFQKFEKISNEYQTYRLENERLKHPFDKPHDTIGPAL